MSPYLKSASRVSAAAPASDPTAVRKVVEDVIDAVRERGDEAVREFSAKFDNWSPDSFRLSAADIERIVSGVPDQVIADIGTAQTNVRNFAERQLASLTDFEVETQ